MVGWWRGRGGGGEHGLEEVRSLGAGSASEGPQPAEQDSPTPQHRSLAGHGAIAHLWWVQRREAPASPAHIWPLPDKRQTHRQWREPKSQVKKTQAVNWAPMSFPPLGPLMKIYSPGCPGCLERGVESSTGPTGRHSFLLIYRQISLLPPLSVLKPSVSCPGR